MKNIRRFFSEIFSIIFPSKEERYFQMIEMDAEERGELKW